LIDRDVFPRGAVCAGWVNAKVQPLLEQMGIATSSLLDCPLGDISFFNADLSKTAQPVFEDAPGYMVDRSEFDNALVQAAVGLGVELLQGSPAIELSLGENSVKVRLEDEREVSAKLLLLASGRTAELRDRVGLAPDRATPPLWTAQAVAQTKGGKSASASVDLILGVDRKGSFAMLSAAKGRVSATINWFGDPGEAIPALIRICQMAEQKGILSADLSSHAAEATVMRSPASVALDMDTHVGKHALVIGDAGGFVSSASNEGIYPAMWSAQVAAEVANEAIDSTPSQDVLMGFDAKWRIQMADYLRSPHTDIQFLLPLIFSTQPMADRMGAAFFSGENI
jgi:flavin-dependent dehydrogenase